MPLIIDSTVATPYLNRPIEWGADIVIHSATKFLGGHGTTLGGVVVESGRFDWHSERFPLFDQPVPLLRRAEVAGNFGEYAFLTRLRAEQLRDIGPSLAPHSAFLLAQGVETLPLPHAGARRQRARRRRVARGRRPRRVGELGRAARAPAPRARGASTCPRGPERVQLRRRRAAASVGQRFIERVDLASHLANIGDAKTLVIHPASTTHAQLSEQQLLDARRAAGPGADQRRHRGRRRTSSTTSTRR